MKYRCATLNGIGLGRMALTGKDQNFIGLKISRHMFGSSGVKWKGSLARIGNGSCDNPATHGSHPLNTVETFWV